MTEPMREEMHKVWGEKFLCTQNYGMSELCGPGVAGECEELCGMHINEDWFIPEVIYPKTGEVLPAGEKGELVITCLGKEALPLFFHIYKVHKIISSNHRFYNAPTEGLLSQRRLKKYCFRFLRLVLIMRL